MMERVLPMGQPAAAGRGRGSQGVLVALALEDHRHSWQRLPDSVGLFFCTDRRCLWCAVCPGCLGSLDIALLVRDGIEGMALYWCAACARGGEHAQ